MRKTTYFKMVLLVVLLVGSSTVWGQLADGNLVVEQVGDGSTSLSGNATTVKLLQFSPTGTPGTSTSFFGSTGTPTTSPYNIVESGSATSNGFISLSADKSFVVVPGYNAPNATASIAGSASGTYGRTIGKVAFTGVLQTNGTFNALTGNNYRSIVSDGSSYWLTGGVGIFYTSTDASSGIGTGTSIYATNTRNGLIFNNTLLVSTSSTSFNGAGSLLGIYQVGSFNSLPTATVTAGTAINIINTGTGSSPYAFSISPNGLICYIADDRATTASGGIQKWIYSGTFSTSTGWSGGTWSLAYSLATGVSTTVGARGITVDFSGANPVIYGTSTESTLNRVFKITDTGSASTASTLATATTNYIFRGICFAPKTPTYTTNSTGSGNWSSASSWVGNAVPVSLANVVVNDNLTLDQDATVNTLAVNSGATLTNSSKNLTVSTFNINSDANGTGSFVDNGSTTVTGTANVNQYLTYRTWYMSSPVANAQPTGMNWIKSYNEVDDTWPTLFDARAESAVAYGTNTFVTGKGYLVVPVSGNSIQFSGVLNTGNQNINLTRSDGNTLNSGFNLIGNPYPSYLDWSKVLTANSSIMPTTTMWYRTKDGATYKFWTVNGDGVSSPNGASQYIPPMQAFWVRTIANNSMLNLTNDMRTNAPATDYLLKAPAAGNTQKTLLRLQVSNGTNTDETVIYFSENSSNGQDTNDAPKMSNNDPAIPEIFTRAGNDRLVINSMNNIPLNQEIAMGFVAGDASSFSIKANELSNLPSDVKVILKDNVTKTETDLTDGSAVYTFSPDATTGDRFSVIFRAASITTGVANPVDQKVSVSSNASHQLTVTYNDVSNSASEVSVYNAVGQRLITQPYLGNTTVIARTFNPGIYVVKINNVIRKVVVE